MPTMILPYQLPHECESAEIAEAMAGLTPRQRRVLRSFLWQVELGEKSLTGWLAGPGCPVARSTWYAHYAGNVAFQQALGLYRQAGLRWQAGQEQRSVEAAQRRIRQAASPAAERLVDQVQADLGQFFRVVERWTDAPLPSQEILQEELREGRKFFLVRQAVIDLGRLADPRYSRMVRKFSDSPTRGLSIEVYDAQRAAESILDRADLETASKAETRVAATLSLDEATVDRLDQALMATLYGGADGDEDGVGE